MSVAAILVPLLISQSSAQQADRAGSVRGGRALLLTFKPEGLPAGHYVLKVRVSDRVSRRSSEAATPFDVAPAKS